MGFMMSGFGSKKGVLRYGEGALGERISSLELLEFFNFNGSDLLLDVGWKAQSSNLPLHHYSMDEKFVFIENHRYQSLLRIDINIMIAPRHAPTMQFFEKRHL